MSQPRLLDRVRDAICPRHYSLRTEETYTAWVRRFILFHTKRHPQEMGADEVRLICPCGRTCLPADHRAMRQGCAHHHDLHPCAQQGRAGGSQSIGPTLTVKDRPETTKAASGPEPVAASDIGRSAKKAVSSISSLA
jgi:hypothetical protein